MHASSDPAPLLDALYQTIEDEQQWPVFLEGLAIHMSARSASLRLVDIDGPCVYRSYTHGYNNLLDTFYVAGGYLSRGDDGRAWQLGVHRSSRCRPFSTRELEQLEYLAPHLRRAIQLGEQLSASQRALEQTRNILDEVSFGIWLLDARGNCLWMNRPANDAARDTTTGLTLDCGKLGHRNNATAKALRYALSETLKGLLRANHVALDTLGRGLLISPLSSSLCNHALEDSRALVMLVDPLRQRELNTEILGAQYQLTPAEARLARHLATGATLDCIAADLGVSPNTVRSQLRSLLRKTDTKRQAELIRVLLLGPALRP